MTGSEWGHSPHVTHPIRHHHSIKGAHVLSKGDPLSTSCQVTSTSTLHLRS